MLQRSTCLPFAFEISQCPYNGCNQRSSESQLWQTKSGSRFYTFFMSPFFFFCTGYTVSSALLICCWKMASDIPNKVNLHLPSQSHCQAAFKHLVFFFFFFLFVFFSLLSVELTMVLNALLLFPFDCSCSKRAFSGVSVSTADLRLRYTIVCFLSPALGNGPTYSGKNSSFFFLNL